MKIAAKISPKPPKLPLKYKYVYGFRGRDKVVQKATTSLEMTDRVMERTYHPSRELAPC